MTIYFSVHTVNFSNLIWVISKIIYISVQFLCIIVHGFGVLLTLHNKLQKEYWNYTLMHMNLLIPGDLATGWMITPAWKRRIFYGTKPQKPLDRNDSIHMTSGYTCESVSHDCCGCANKFIWAPKNCLFSEAWNCCTVGLAIKVHKQCSCTVNL